MIRFNKLLIYLCLTFLVTSCAETKNEIVAESKTPFVWTDELINKALIDTCVTSSQWKSINPDEVPFDYRSSSPVDFVDTSGLTEFPTVIVAGFCPHDAGAGWGNEFFLIGYREELTKKVFIIDKILGEDSGLVIQNKLKVNDNKEILLELKGYSDEMLCAACRDAVDVVEIEIINNKSKVNYLSSNTYQIREKINGINKTNTADSQESTAPQSSNTSSSNSGPSETECLNLYEKEKQISDIKSEIALLEELMWQYEFGSQQYKDYRKQIDFENGKLSKMESEYSNLLNDDTVFCSWHWNNPYK